MRYKVFIKEGTKPAQFLNAASELYYLKRKQADINRWLFEMGIVIEKSEDVVFNLYEDDEIILTRTLVCNSSRSWKKPRKGTK